MKKNILKFLPILVISFLLMACSQTQSKKEKTYDQEFSKALANGLEERWNYTDKNSNLEELNSKKGFTTAVDKELKNISKFEDLKFKNSKLKEAAISYINILKESKKIANTFGADSFYLEWEENYKLRNEKLIDLNSITPIKVSESNTYILEELLASGTEVKNSNIQDKKVQELIDSIIFVKNESESNEFYSKYEAIIENNTGLNVASLSASIKLINAEGVAVETQYLNANNWNAGEKYQFEFTTSESFEKTEITIEFKEITK